MRPAILSPGLWREGSLQRLPHLLAFVKNVSLLKPSVDPSCTWGGVHALANASGDG